MSPVTKLAVAPCVLGLQIFLFSSPSSLPAILFSSPTSSGGAAAWWRSPATCLPPPPWWRVTEAAKVAVRAAVKAGLVDGGGRLLSFLSCFSISLFGGDDGGLAVDGLEKVDGRRRTVGGGRWHFWRFFFLKCGLNHFGYFSSIYGNFKFNYRNFNFCFSLV